MSLPLLLTVALPPLTSSVPLVTASVTVIVPVLPSAASEMARPVMALLVSSLVVCATGTVLTGASFTAVILMTKLSVSVSGPPAPVFPPSLVVIVNTTVPLALPAVV